MIEPDEPPWAVISLASAGGDVPIGRVRPAARCDLAVVDGLLRLSLAARRCGLTVRLTDVHCDLRELAELVGVTEQLGIRT